MASTPWWGTGTGEAESVAFRVRDALGVYRRLVGAQVRGQMQYKVGFAMDLVANFMATFTDFLAILIVYTRFSQIGGWRMPEVALLYGTVATSFALADLFARGFQDFADLIRLGSFDGILLRPRSAVLQVLGSELQLRSIGRLSQAVTVLLLALSWLNVRSFWTGWDVLFLAWTILGGLAFFAGIQLMSATFCFWTVESGEVFNIVTYGGTDMASYPLHIFSPPLRRIFTYLIPLAFVNYYPVLHLLRKADPLGLPAWAAFAAFPACVLVLLAGYLCWREGVRHYVSTGS